MNSYPFRKKKLVFLALLWAMAQWYTFSRFGILTGLEPAKYIKEAGHLIDQGRLSDTGYIFYSLEILLIAALKASHANIAYAVIVHVAINALAVTCLWKLISSLTDIHTATISTALFIVFLPVQQFNFQLQTESLFFSLIIFHTYFAIASGKGKKSALWGMIIAQILLILCRPTGVLWLLPTTLALYHVVHRSINKKIAFYLCAGLLLLSILAIEFVVGKIGQFNLIAPWENGNIICEVPSGEIQPIVVHEKDPRSISTPFAIIRDNFTFFLKISYQKTISFFGLYRPYYSRTHNILLILYAVVIYIFSIIGLFLSPKSDRRALSIPLCGILTTYVMVLLTCDDWHNRFSLSVLSLILILAAKGIFELKKKFKPI